jgi:hypothetical protein
MGGTFRVGFAYRNGSVVRVACRDMDGTIHLRAVPAGVLVINFTDHRTDRNAESLISSDFDIEWLDYGARRLISAELGAQTLEWAEALDDLIDNLMGLSVEQLRRLTQSLR